MLVLPFLLYSFGLTAFKSPPCCNIANWLQQLSLQTARLQIAKLPFTFPPLLLKGTLFFWIQSRQRVDPSTVMSQY